MTRTVNCVVLGKNLPGLDEVPYPGELGQRVYENVSAQAWQGWLERLVMIVNEYQLNSADTRALDTIEKHMLGYLFNEGDYGKKPEGFVAK